MTKEARIHSGGKTASSINGVGKLDSYIKKQNKKQTKKLDYFLDTIYKNKLKWTKDLHIRPETIQFIEENIGFTFWSYHHMYFFRPCLQHVEVPRPEIKPVSQQ